ncbi:MAG: right-handed parallel beta-helix repeat-containing protein, partial [Chloroflexi bacterium]|nr:right-handed parallel beta-helix repeat-containing protein [Chloroflexota bacterium]
MGNKPLFVYAESGQIVVADNAVIVQTNTICSLIEAIENANDTTTGQPHTDCNPGNPNGADVIVLPRRGEFVLTAVYPGVYPGNDDAFGLPTITSQIIIEGNGSTIMRQENAPDFGIFFIELGNLTINNAKITGAAGNHALYAFFSQLTIKNSDIFNNNSGGIAAGDSDLTLLDSEIFHNVNESFGGGIFVGWSSIYMRNTTVYENEANNGGGIAIRWGLGVNINNSTISGNASRQHGGGIYFDGNANVNDVSISSSTITNNRAMSDGGGIYSAATFEATAIHLNHNLIAGNQAGAEGAEIKITSPDTIVAANNYNLFGHDGVNTSA